jgi:hypothetical protein
MSALKNVFDLNKSDAIKEGKISDNNLTSEKKKLSADMFMKMLKESKDPREVAYSMIVDYLMDENKLLMTSILKGEYPEYIIKNLILIDFYQNYYANIKVKISFEKSENPPYYIRNVDYSAFTDDLKQNLLNKYPQLVKNLMMVTISKDGIGRNQFLGILKAADEFMDLKNKIGSWMNDKLQ